MSDNEKIQQAIIQLVAAAHTLLQDPDSTNSRATALLAAGDAIDLIADVDSKAMDEVVERTKARLKVESI